MKKVRINATLRHKLETYVRGQIDAGLDKTPLEVARRRLEEEALRLVAAAYSAEDMRLLAKYGKTGRYARFSFLMPDDESQSVEFSRDLPYDLPQCGGYRFEPPIPADEAFNVAVREAGSVADALRAEAVRRWKQAEVLVGCALYFEDVLDYPGIPAGERVSLSRLWHPPVEPQPVEEGGETAESGETGAIPTPYGFGKSPTSALIEAIEPVIDYAESEALALESLKDGEEAEAEAERAWRIIANARTAIAREKAA